MTSLFEPTIQPTALLRHAGEREETEPVRSRDEHRHGGQRRAGGQHAGAVLARWLESELVKEVLRRGEESDCPDRGGEEQCGDARTERARPQKGGERDSGRRLCDLERPDRIGRVQALHR